MAQRKLDRDTSFFCKKKDDPLMDFPVVYLPCDHNYYHSPVITRSLLGHKQYTDFLATPKGFCWNKHSGLVEKKKWKVCQKKKCNDEEPLLQTDQRFINDFLSDIWNSLTPECIKVLENILVEEYGMSNEKARGFLEQQRIRSIFSNERATTRINLSERHKYAEKYARLISKKVSNYLDMMLNAKRTKRVKSIAQVLLAKLGELTGEECTLSEPQNPFESAQVFLADRLAVWLGNVVLEDELDPEVCRKDELASRDKAYASQGGQTAG